MTRKNVDENKIVSRSEIGPVLINKNEKFVRIEVLKYVEPAEIEPKRPITVAEPLPR